MGEKSGVRNADRASGLGYGSASSSPLDSESEPPNFEMLDSMAPSTLEADLRRIDSYLPSLASRCG